VKNDMTIAREEIFGPVLVMIGYEDDDDAVRIANETDYGLSGYVSGSTDRARSIARRIRSGNVHLNGAGPDFNAPFGGYRQSGNGREWGPEGFGSNRVSQSRTTPKGGGRVNRGSPTGAPRIRIITSAHRAP
jgi:aldehyde dehydrogenase (NAD+)